MRVGRKRPDLAERNRLRATHGATVGGDQTGAWRAWSSMLKRVQPGSKDAKNYAERGICVCDRWRQFENFLADMGERPAGASIERINNSLGYEPGNCRWATQLEQARNRRSNRLLTFDGVTRTTSEWSEVTGIERHTLGHRVRSGWSVEDALTVPVTKANRWRQKR